MDQSINFIVYVKVISEAKGFPTDRLPNKELGDRTSQRKKTSVGVEPTTSGLDRPFGSAA